ncbi:beta-hexosaminidase subunit a1-related [Anaeramoeba ignava]|uniref:Beta-hexosaminidase n=1 Tax=Anaeramoeba ignava TaxID=1746090 RepID=A0A9Q0LN57_ANAIG|nr:beta-hexosaminidase subunit a1-related [Anaeramoeba ignava]
MNFFHLLIILSLLLSLNFSQAPLIWPKPQSATYGTKEVIVDPTTFAIHLQGAGSTSQILQEQVQYYLGLLFPFTVVKSKVDNLDSSINLLVLNVKSDNEDLQLGVDESYNISIYSSAATADANTIYGALRALETFSQLVSYNYTTEQYTIENTPITIIDYPRFPWRGILIDTARHFLPVSAIKETIAGMAYSKFNTFHWHGVDAQSFPLYITKYPQITTNALFYKNYFYSTQDIQEIINYAKKFGIRVVLELDGPGHSASLGFGMPELTAKCPKYESNINNIPVDPTKDFTFEVLNDIWTEMSSYLLDQHIHFGGDEVVTGCWLDDPDIKQWMADHGMSTTQLEEYYWVHMNQIRDNLGKKSVVWQEVYNLQNSTILKNAMVQVWNDISNIQDIVNNGYEAINSYGWYLDKQIPGTQTHYEWIDTWIDFYNLEPYNYISTNRDKFLGGEACSWSEQVNWSSLANRLWPRAAAVAERLWSSKDTNDVSDATVRLNQQSCRLVQRGINSAPLYPGFCFVGNQ